MEQNYIIPILIFLPMIGAFIGYGIGRVNKTWRNHWACLVTAVVFFGSLSLIGSDATFVMENVCGLGLHFETDGLQVVLAILAAFAWFATTVFSEEYFAHYHNRNRYYFFLLMTLGATLGVFLSADFYTTFVFFEMMSFTSFVLVIHDETTEAIKAAGTYLTVAIFGGLVTLMGLFWMYHMAGTLAFSELADFVAAQEDVSGMYTCAILILVGFGAKAGLFPLHIWLPEAHPVAPAPASALLSCILTKSGIFGVLILSTKLFLYDGTWGYFMLTLGTITMVLGAVLAVFSINLKRVMACSSLSQIGFIVVGIGMQGILGSHNALAAGGTILHVANHSILKVVLFLSAGAIYMNLHKLDLNDIRGWGKDKPFLKAVFLMGSLGIMGIPLWNGYISKTLLHESIVEGIVMLEEVGQSALYLQTVEVLFLFSGGLTVAYMTKIFVAIFMEENPYATKEVHHKSYISKPSMIALGIPAFILPILGIFPHQTMDVIADFSYHFMGAHAPDHAVHYFAWVNLKGAVISVVVGALVYGLFIRKVLMQTDANGNRIYCNLVPEWLSLENKVYRPALLQILPFIGGFFARMAGNLVDGCIAISRILVFNSDGAKFIPGEDQYFSVYTHAEAPKKVYHEDFARSLMMVGLGLAAVLLYILF
ncbi:complex I subunit 5 family protein [Chakrabartyella piscis]|uniref:complex I subunit 5 family protein n=1 Tax=Chakrabartyella piscis TaxID=2918914 RepID=UPI002958C80E|nr:complex I subunit 5 family protein [Chakrabartyella piscis]